jgi:hypothetical protein
MVSGDDTRTLLRSDCSESFSASAERHSAYKQTFSSVRLQSELNILRIRFNARTWNPQLAAPAPKSLPNRCASLATLLGETRGSVVPLWDWRISKIPLLTSAATRVFNFSAFCVCRLLRTPHERVYSCFKSTSKPGFACVDMLPKRWVSGCCRCGTAPLRKIRCFI